MSAEEPKPTFAPVFCTVQATDQADSGILGEIFKVCTTPRERSIVHASVQREDFP